MNWSCKVNKLIKSKWNREREKGEMNKIGKLCKKYRLLIFCINFQCISNGACTLFKDLSLFFTIFGMH